MSVGLLREYVTLMVEKVRTKKGQKGVMGDRFDLKRFKSLPDQRSMLAYASKFLQKLGTGSSRATFLLSGKHALKIALNEKGVGQNEAEMDVFTNSKNSNIVAKVYDYDENSRWIVSDAVREFSDPKEFQQLTGTDWETFAKTVYDWLGRKATKTMKPDGFTASVIKFAQANKMLPGDIEEINHWGKTADGRVVMLDYGQTEGVWNKHYKDNQLPQAKSAASDDKTAVPGSKQGSNTDKTAASGNRTKPTQYSPDGKTAAPKKNVVSDEKTAAPQRKRAVGDGGTQPSQYKPDEDSEKTRR